MSTRTIEIRDVGPIELLREECPEGGGVVVLKARNGKGKSIGLGAIDAAVSGRGAKDLRVRDGKVRGQVTAFGATLTISRQARRDGTGCVVESLEGKFDLATLVDPQLIQPLSADAKRIKALVSLAGVKPDIGLFAQLFRTEAEQRDVLTQSAHEADDILVMADRVKRDIEAAARKAEGQANIEAAHVKACNEAALGVDVCVETDSLMLQAAVESALQNQSALRQRRQQAIAQAARSEELRAEIDQYRSQQSGPSLDEIKQRETFAHNAVADAKEALEAARTQLQKCEYELHLAEQHYQHAKNDRESSERYSKTIEELQHALQALGSTVDMPTPEQSAAADEAVTAARNAFEAGVKAKMALEKLAKAEEHKTHEQEAAERAERYRQAAAAVDDVLSEEIQKLGCKLRVKAGRLVLDTHRGETFFADLSDGERWKVAIDIATEFLGENGLLTLSQVAWEGLDPIAREEIRDHAKLRGVLIVTAECSTDETVTAEILN